MTPHLIVAPNKSKGVLQLHLYSTQVKKGQRSQFLDTRATGQRSRVAGYSCKGLRSRVAGFSCKGQRSRAAWDSINLLQDTRIWDSIPLLLDTRRKGLRNAPVDEHSVYWTCTFIHITASTNIL